MNFKLLMVFVDQDKTDVVLDASREAGATGATIIPSAQGRGLKLHPTFFGLEFLAARSVILIVVEARRSSEVLKAVTEAGGMDESLDTGIALELEVSQAFGLSEHIKALSKEHPVSKT